MNIEIILLFLYTYHDYLIIVILLRYLIFKIGGTSMITNISLYNFKIFEGENTIDISNNLHTDIAIVCSSGSGKSSILQAVDWCLFGTRSTANSNEQYNHLANFNMLNNNPNKQIKVYVELHLTNNHKSSITLRRESEFILEFGWVICNQPDTLYINRNPVNNFDYSQCIAKYFPKSLQVLECNGLQQIPFPFSKWLHDKLLIILSENIFGCNFLSNSLKEQLIIKYTESLCESLDNIYHSLSPICTEDNFSIENGMIILHDKYSTYNSISTLSCYQRCALQLSIFLALQELCEQISSTSHGPIFIDTDCLWGHDASIENNILEQFLNLCHGRQVILTISNKDSRNFLQKYPHFNAFESIKSEKGHAGIITAYISNLTNI